MVKSLQKQLFASSENYDEFNLPCYQANIYVCEWGFHGKGKIIFFLFLFFNRRNKTKININLMS